MADDDAGEALPGLLARGVAVAERLVAENRRLRRELDSREAETRDAEAETHELASLYIAARQMLGTHDPRDVLRAVVEILVNFIGAKTFALYLRDETGTVLRPVVGHGLHIEDMPAAGAESTIGQVFLTREPPVGDDIAPAPLDGPPRLAVPLRLGDTSVGVVAVWAFLAHKAELYDVDRALLDLISTHAAHALEAARLAAAGPGGSLDYASVAELLE